MTNNEAWAAHFVEALVAGGIRHAVLAPGARCAPLAYALHRHHAIKLRVLHDERAAAFCALGAAKGTGQPVAVVTTSGTAVANLHPALLEARHSCTPLVAVTADRPPGASATGENQTIEQAGIFGGGIRHRLLPLPTPQSQAAAKATMNSVADDVASAAADGRPLHLNVPFDKPLIGPGQPPEGTLFTVERPSVGESSGASVEVPRVAGRVLLIVGPEVRLPLDWHSPVPMWADAVGTTRATVDTLPALPPADDVDAVVQVGVNPTDAEVLAWLAAWDGPRYVIDPLGRCPPGATSLPAAAGLVATLGLDAWTLDAEWPSPPDEPGVLLLQEVVTDLAANGGDLWIGNSTPVRDLQALRPRCRVLGNRGVSGIDGQIASAAGAAWATGERVVCVVGDHSFLHDLTGLEAVRDTACEVVVVNNGGGRIFDRLPLGHPERPAYEELFVAPHDAHLASAARVWGVESQVRIVQIAAGN